MKIAHYLLVIFAFGSAQAEPRFGLGPLEIPSQFPLTAIHQSFTPSSAEITSSGAYKLSLDSFLSNTFISDESYLIDCETAEWRAGLTAGLGHGWDIKLTVPVLWRGGGFLDSTIRNWHEFFGLPEGRRDSVKNDQFDIFGGNADRSSFAIDDDSFGLGSIEILPRFSVFEDPNYALTALAGISLPAFGSSYANSGVDFIVGIQASVVPDSEGSWVLHGGVSGIFFTDSKQDNIEYERFHSEGSFGAEYRLSPNFSFVAGLLASTEFIDSIATFPSYAVYLDAGIKTVVSGFTIGLGLRENPGPHDSTTDVSFALTIATVLAQ